MITRVLVGIALAGIGLAASYFAVILAALSCLDEGLDMCYPHHLGFEVAGVLALIGSFWFLTYRLNPILYYLLAMVLSFVPVYFFSYLRYSARSAFLAGLLTFLGFVLLQILRRRLVVNGKQLFYGGTYTHHRKRR